MKAPGFSSLIKLALPLYLGMLANTIVGLVDTAILGRVSETAQSAGGYGALFYTVVFVGAYGFSLALQIRMARRIGEKKRWIVGALFRSAFLSMLLAAIVLSVLSWFGAVSLFNGLLKVEEIANLSADYFRIRGLGLPFTLANLCFMALFIASGKSLPIGISNGIAGVVNVSLDFLLVFGVGELIPAMGIQGAAIASAMADFSGFIVYVIAFFRILYRGPYFSVKAPIRLSYLAETFKVALPLIVQNLLSMVSWFLFFTFIEKTGEQNFHISIVVRSVYSLFMMAGFALGSVSNAQVSTLLGAESPGEIPRLLKRTGFIALSLTFVSGLFILLFRSSLLGLFNPNPELAQLAGPTLTVLFVALNLFAVSHVLFNAVSGTGNTWRALRIESACIVLYLAYTIWMCFFVQGVDLAVIWLAEILYMVCIGLASFQFIRRFLSKAVPL
jgi:multidrug resistance protein, MATE family